MYAAESRDERTRWENRTPNSGNSNRNKCKFMQENEERERAPGHVTCESPKNDSKILMGGFWRGKMGLKAPQLWGGALSQ